MASAIWMISAGHLRASAIRSSDEDEERYVNLGMDFLGRLLVVVYTYRGDAIRIISARNATRAEQRQYAEDL